MTNQQHGKKYEDHIKSAFPGASDCGRTNTSGWDIEAIHDNIHGCPTSIKTTKTDGVALADARRFFGITETYIMLICKWKQITKTVKHFYELYEFIITPDIHKILLGSLTYEEVENFHNQLKTFPLGKDKEARIFAKRLKEELQPKTNVELCYKVHTSSNQRRLQGGISLKKLMEIVPNFKIYKEFYRDVDINLKVKSKKRELKSRKK